MIIRCGWMGDATTDAKNLPRSRSNSDSGRKFIPPSIIVTAPSVHDLTHSPQAMHSAAISVGQIAHWKPTSLESPPSAICMDGHDRGATKGITVTNSDYGRDSY